MRTKRFARLDRAFLTVLLVLSNPALTHPADHARLDRGRSLECYESDPAAFRVVKELGRLEAEDDLNSSVYAFIVCQESDTANDTFELKITSNFLVGTSWRKDEGVQLAKDMLAAEVQCKPWITPYNAVGANDKRRVEYIFCQKGGQPEAIEIRVTTLNADATPKPEKMLRLRWPG
jgi:hypothetical protein